MAKNVFGDDLLVCSADPLTGFFRTGKCETCGDDHGMHTVCAVMTEEFLRFSKKAGNDLSAPHPEYHFPGLQPGDDSKGEKTFTGRQAALSTQRIDKTCSVGNLH